MFLVIRFDKVAHSTDVIALCEDQDTANKVVQFDKACLVHEEMCADMEDVAATYVYKIDFIVPTTVKELDELKNSLGM